MYIQLQMDIPVTNVNYNYKCYVGQNSKIQVNYLYFECN